jgi:hypothetical protein
MKLRNLLLVVFVVPALAATVFSKGNAGKGKVSNLPVTTDLQTNDLAGYVSDIQNEGLGVYHDGVDSVTSFLTTNGYNGIVWGDWQFGTLDSTTRKVTFSFTSPIALADGGTAVPNPPFSIGNVTAHIEDKCTILTYSMISMSTGDTMPCPVAIRFYTSDGGDWSISIAPNWTSLAETTFVQVTCNSVDSSGCNDWFIDPIPANMGGDPLGAVGRLTYNGCSSCKGRGGKTSASENRGDFHFRFHFHITRP